MDTKQGKNPAEYRDNRKHAGGRTILPRYHRHGCHACRDAGREKGNATGNGGECSQQKRTSTQSKIGYPIDLLSLHRTLRQSVLIHETMVRSENRRGATEPPERKELAREGDSRGHNQDDHDGQPIQQP